MTPDEQEALSSKYTAPRVLPLSSGNFAIFDIWDQAEGLPLITICPAEEVLSRLREYRPREITRARAPEAIDLAALGLI